MKPAFTFTLRTFFVHAGILLMLLLLGVWLWQPKWLPSFAENKTQPQNVHWQQIHIDEVKVYKAKRQLQLLEKGKVVKIYAMRLGFEPLGHKTTEGDGKTPEGRYVLDWRNPNSQFYKSLHISYPNEQDKQQAKMRGVSAGENIMIHGSSRIQGQSKQVLYDYLPQKDWTLGCIALSNQDMDEVWHNVKNGTPITIYP